MKFKTLAAAVIGSVIAMAGNAFAEVEATAMIVDMRAPVMVNQGEQYVAAKPGMRLQPGDQLMAMNGGSARVNFRAGCDFTLGANEVLRIGSVDACASPGGAQPVNAQMAPVAGMAAGGGGAAAGGGLGLAELVIGASGTAAAAGGLTLDNKRCRPWVSGKPRPPHVGWGNACANGRPQGGKG